MSRIVQGMIFGLVTLACLSADDAHGQSRVRFGISVGNGVRVGVGNGYYGGYYGPYGYGYRPPVVIAPQPVVVPQPVYVQPQPQPLPQPPYVPMPASPAPDGGEIMLFSPSTNLGPIRYTLNGQPYTMNPGTKQKFTNDRVWNIQFESTPGNVSTYTLSSTRYKFKTTDTGLGLFATHDHPEGVHPALPPAPIPNPPEEEETIVPTRPVLKTIP